MRIALTGVPGTGKTTVAKALAARGARIVHLNEFAAKHKLLGDADPERGSLEVDLDALNEAVLEHVPDSRALVVLEGHFAHELDVDLVVLLRVDPLVLVDRLRARGWSEAKVRENVEAEALDVLAGEVIETGIPAAEVDASHLGVEDVADMVWTIAENGPEAFKGATVGSLAWSLETLPWF
jgi:adenylate kinase